MKKDFKPGDKLAILLDPLSSHESSLLIEVKIVDRREAPQQAAGDVFVLLDVAAYQVLSEREVEWGNPLVQVDYGNWANISMTGKVETIVSLDGQPWHHTCWPVAVNFIEEAK